MTDQDWKPVVWLNKIDKGTKAQQLNAARRKGKNVTTMKRNKDTLSKKLDDDDGTYKIDKISHELKTLLRDHRVKSGYRTQKDLATAMNLKVTIIQGYESGKLNPSPQILSRMERLFQSKDPSFVIGTLTKARRKQKNNINK